MLKDPRRLTEEEIDLIVPHLLYIFDLYYGLSFDSARDFPSSSHCNDWYNECVRLMNEDEQWKDDKHSGDCQNEAHTCMRCFVEGCRFEVRELIERSKEWEEND